jgi:hypothetical protein
MNEISEIDIDMCLNFDLLPGSRCLKHMVVCSQDTFSPSKKWRTFAYGTYMTYFNLNTNKHTKKPSYAVTNDTICVGNGNHLRCAPHVGHSLIQTPQLSWPSNSKESHFCWLTNQRFELLIYFDFSWLCGLQNGADTTQRSEEGRELSNHC